MVADERSSPSQVSERGLQCHGPKRQHSSRSELSQPSPPGEQGSAGVRALPWGVVAAMSRGEKDTPWVGFNCKSLITPPALLDAFHGSYGGYLRVPQVAFPGSFTPRHIHTLGCASLRHHRTGTYV